MKVVIGILACLSLGMAIQNRNLTGTVVDPENNPVADVAVQLKVLDQPGTLYQTTTDAQGGFEIIVTPTFTLKQQDLLKTELKGDYLILSNHNSPTLELTILNLQGKSIKQISISNPGQGTHRFNIAGQIPSEGIYFIQVTAGEHDLVFKIAVLNSEGKSKFLQKPLSPSKKVSAASDTLLLSKAGYHDGVFEISSVDSTLGSITLFPVDLTVSALLTPFDANESDRGGPSSWSTNYGKIPEIVVASNGTELDVLAQDYNSATPYSAVLMHIKPNGTDYIITQALTDLPMLDRVMGLAIDETGTRYYATGVDEDDAVDPDYPPLDTYRQNIVRVIKIDSAGGLLYNIDLDVARHDFNENAEMIINPMVAATSRLAVGGDEIGLVHGINTDPDWNINGTRHQKALSTRLNATSGAITRTSSIWVSHSFDQRLLYDGSGIIEHHLGDSYPRYIVFAKDHDTYSLHYIKGAQGANNTRTRLGNVALIENDATYGYIALFSTESTTGFENTISGPRNLAIVRVHGTNSSLDPALPDVLTVSSSGQQETNRLRWLTSYSEQSNLHAERPKLIGIGGDQYIVLWEEWQSDGDDTFNGVYAMLIDAQGEIQQTATLVTSQHHLHRGDDAFLLDGKAGWMTGNEAGKKLYIHLVDAALNYQMVTLD